MGMTNTEAIKSLNTLRESINGVFDYNCRKQCIALDIAIQALEQQSSDDCISREEAIRVAEQGQIQGYEWQFKKLCTLPSVTPIISKMEQVEDCISRKAVEEITWEEPSYTDALNAITEIRDKIRQLPSVTPQSKTGWIPVSERLPETDGVYLTYIVNTYDNQLSYIMICDYIHPKWFPIDETASSNVVAWMPLPTIYQGEENG